MNTETAVERTAPQSAYRNPVWYCALISACVWILCALFTYAAAALSVIFFFSAVLGSTALCLGISKSRAVFAVVTAIPLFALVAWLREPTLCIGMLALGGGGITVLTYHATRGSKIDAQNLWVAVAMPMFIILAGCVNAGIAYLTPHIYDSTLLALDCGVSTASYRWALARPLQFAIVSGIYFALPLWAAIVIAFTTGQTRAHLLRALCFAALLAVPCYFLLPAVGPVHIGQPFAARNCMPSLHLTWAALLWLNAPPGWFRWSALSFMLLTAYAALAFGEHYVLDLIAAAPFTWAVQQLSKTAVQRSTL